MTAKDERAVIALQRFGLGGRAGSRTAILSDPQGACLAEIGPEKAIIPKGDRPDTARGIQIVSEIEERRREERSRRREVAQAPPGPDMSAAMPQAAVPAQRPNMPPDPDEIRLNDVLAAEVKARLEFGYALPLGFAERWAQFWSNHFCIALRRGQILRGIAGAYEREAIRPHVFARFETLLVAVETHPAMLHYLDQRQSIGPNSPAGLRQKRGLNENLAREILELHTLGVQGGYTQADVTAFARVLTGWSITGREENIDGFGGFVFAPNRHEPGAQVVLGKSYPDAGKEQGLAVLRDLARHRSTAGFLAGKIARHFVADRPPAALVNRLAERFRATDGDLAEVARALVTAPEAWAPARSKLRMPAEFVLAAYRAASHLPERPQQAMNALNLMGQPLWNPAGPNGHADDENALAAPKAIKTRLDLALQFARQVGGRIDPRELARDLWGDVLSAETRTAIARAETRPQGLALLLMSPEFQRR